jgi:hypothetical protein
LSHERVLKALVSLGLSRRAAEVYVFLATKGPQKKRIVRAARDCSALYSALPFEKAIDLLLEAKRKEAQSIEQNKEEILFEWHLMMR